MEGFPRFLKLCTLSVTALALGLALIGPRSVFDLVLLSVSVMGSCFAPLLIVRAFRRPLNAPTALAMIGGALLMVVFWRHMGWHKGMFEAMPGIITAFAIYVLGTGLSFGLKRRHENA